MKPLWDKLKAVLAEIKAKADLAATDEVAVAAAKQEEEAAKAKTSPKK